MCRDGMERSIVSCAAALHCKQRRSELGGVGHSGHTVYRLSGPPARAGSSGGRMLRLPMDDRPLDGLLRGGVELPDHLLP